MVAATSEKSVMKWIRTSPIPQRLQRGLLCRLTRHYYAPKKEIEKVVVKEARSDLRAAVNCASQAQ